MEQILDWDFDQIIVGHGTVVEKQREGSFSRGVSMAVEMIGVPPTNQQDRND